MPLWRGPRYPVAVYTPHSISECVQRLQMDFKTSTLRIPPETRSDKYLNGRIHDRRFRLELDTQRLRAAGSRRLPSSSSTHAPTFEGELIESEDGTRVLGYYGYGRRLLVQLYIGLVASIVGLVLFSVEGIHAITRGSGQGYGLLLLAACSALGVWFVLDRPDEQELLDSRAYIVRYLEKLLDARSLQDEP